MRGVELGVLLCLRLKDTAPLTISCYLCSFFTLVGLFVGFFRFHENVDGLAVVRVGVPALDTDRQRNQQRAGHHARLDQDHCEGCRSVGRVHGQQYGGEPGHAHQDEDDEQQGDEVAVLADEPTLARLVGAAVVLRRHDHRHDHERERQQAGEVRDRGVRHEHGGLWVAMLVAFNRHVPGARSFSRVRTYPLAR
jgi:hypothetical protein